MPQSICIDQDSCEVWRLGGGTPRAEGVFPPVFPLLFPSDPRQLRSKHLRRAHPGGESKAFSDSDQNGVPIGIGGRLWLLRSTP